MFYIDFSGMSGKRSKRGNKSKKMFNKLCFLPAKKKKKALFSAMK